MTGVSPFPTMFSTFSQTNITFLNTSIMSSANALNLDRCKTFMFGKGLKDVLVVCKESED